MSDLEARMAEALEGCFFWEKTTYYENTGSAMAASIRQAQRKFYTPKEGHKTLDPQKVEVLREKADQLVGGNVDEIINAIRNGISLIYDVDVNDIELFASRKELRAAKAHYYWSINKYMPSISFAEIGRRVGKYHTTVLHGVRVFEGMKDSMGVQIAQMDSIMRNHIELR